MTENQIKNRILLARKSETNPLFEPPVSLEEAVREVNGLKGDDAITEAHVKKFENVLVDIKSAKRVEVTLGYRVTSTSYPLYSDCTSEDKQGNSITVPNGLFSPKEQLAEGSVVAAYVVNEGEYQFLTAGDDAGKVRKCKERCVRATSQWMSGEAYLLRLRQRVAKAQASAAKAASSL